MKKSQTQVLCIYVAEKGHKKLDAQNDLIRDGFELHIKWDENGMDSYLKCETD